MDQPKSKKRPIALPVTLVLLVMSLMGNVLLYTKHIEHTRGNAQEAGQEIVDSFAEGKEDLAYWSAYAERIAALAETDEDGSRLTAAHLGEALQHSGDRGLYEAMRIADETDDERFGEAADAFTDYADQLSKRLQAIGEGSGPLNPDEVKAVDNMMHSFVKLTELANAFPYGVEGSRNALIRLAAGHDWLDLADELQQSLRAHNS